MINSGNVKRPISTFFEWNVSVLPFKVSFHFWKTFLRLNYLFIFFHKQVSDYIRVQYCKVQAYTSVKCASYLEKKFWDSNASVPLVISWSFVNQSEKGVLPSTASEVVFFVVDSSSEWTSYLKWNNGIPQTSPKYFFIFKKIIIGLFLFHQKAAVFLYFFVFPL